MESWFKEVKEEDKEIRNILKKIVHLREMID